MRRCVRMHRGSRLVLRGNHRVSTTAGGPSVSGSRVPGRRDVLAFVVALGLTLATSAAAQPADTTTAGGPAPASGLVANDVPNDAGRALQLKWKPSPDDREGGAVTTYYVERATEPGGPWSLVD